MVNIVDRETTLCISLAARPSNHGVRFHNYLYDRLGLNYLYKACAPSEITAAVAGIRGLNIRGAGVSMPYKEDVIPLLDKLDPSAERLQSVNTIVNDGDVLTGYNTDYIAVRRLLKRSSATPETTVAVRGSGGMARAVVAALTDHGMRGTVVARNQATGSRLAADFGWEFSTQLPREVQMLVNVTPIGMYGGEPGSEEELAFAVEDIQACEIVLDCVAFPVHTPLVRMAEKLNREVINGGDIIALQAAEQFALYTGVVPDRALVDEAEAYAQQEPAAPPAQPAAE
ncbi:shikimate 5-dehydrogenase [Corynebacterium sp. 13CS0277]|uniref:shikimate 5-dehydrogenase n=1 Tax=Corynebacterium sp. 13CS0277 TaxID=2071994 RepID=UPI000D025A4F|nr:shikimate 5-dehydrogenase [Corynebacterium sp. 13CS0277]PRQ12303.1 shikimate 5-dehydrogenase [Corynebacterium sp. 13CS0277]